MEVSRSAIQANLNVISRHVAPAAPMAVLKANAYGHGLSEVAEICDAHTDWFGVDSIDEALALRRLGIKKPILIMGYVVPERLPEAIRSRISLVVYSLTTVKQLVQAATTLKKVANIHIKLETGLTRQGVNGQELEVMAKYIQAHQDRLHVEGVSMHFANVEDTIDTSYAKTQLASFQDSMACLSAAKIAPKFKHTAASAAALLLPQAREDLVRVGIALYGLWPSSKTQVALQTLAANVRLRPALTWKTVVAQVKAVKKNTPVSYGLTERVRRDSRVAVLPVGYWDGYDRAGMSRRAYVLIKGQRCKVLGRVCMNMFMVDVTDVPNVHVGDEVVLLGSQGKERVSAEELAELCDTISYEIVTRINPTIRRTVVA